MLSLLIVFFSLAITFSFLCSLWEAVLLSITPSYAEMRFREGTSIGKNLRAFKDEIDRPLAAILTLNTIAHTVGAIGVGEQAAIIWSEQSPWITSLAIPVFMTLAILILSELIPKTLGATFWRALVPFTVRSLRIVMVGLAPLVWLSGQITKRLKSEDSTSVLSRSDFVAMTHIGEKEGIFEGAESELIQNLLRFHRIRARDVMTPRMVVDGAPEDMTIRAWYDSKERHVFSRIPIHEPGNRDQVTGYVLKDDVLAAIVREEGDAPLSTLRREILVAHEEDPIPDLFSRFLDAREHIALVVDAFGGLAGIVTMEDVIETLLGLEIVDESDHVEDMQQLARRNWEQRARSLGLDLVPPEPESEPEPAPAAREDEGRE